MGYWIPLISLISSITIFKYKKFNKIKAILYKMFWIDIISDKNNFKNIKAHKFLKLLSMFYFYPYTFIVISMALLSITYTKVTWLTIIFAVAYPLMYRFAMGIQLKIHGKENIIP
jgi:hypothetical protein